jgi:hypothetical protein
VFIIGCCICSFSLYALLCLHVICIKICRSMFECSLRPIFSFVYIRSSPWQKIQHIFSLFCILYRPLECSNERSHGCTGAIQRRKVTKNLTYLTYLTLFSYSPITFVFPLLPIPCILPLIFFRLLSHFCHYPTLWTPNIVLGRQSLLVHWSGWLEALGTLNFQPSYLLQQEMPSIITQETNTENIGTKNHVFFIIDAHNIKLYNVNWNRLYSRPTACCRPFNATMSWTQAKSLYMTASK